MRWPDGIKCLRCNAAAKIYALNARSFYWACCNEDCGERRGYRFSVITKTIFENTNYSLTVWFEVIYLMGQSKKGISALQIHRQIGSGGYRTAWFMCQRIRAAMQDKEFPKLMGEVEVDETHIGGKEKNKHASKRLHAGRGAVGKTTVIGAISRKGNVVCQMIENTDAKTLNGFVRKTVSGNVDLVSTDENAAYH